jgi:hypothetical protein
MYIRLKGEARVSAVVARNLMVSKPPKLRNLGLLSNTIPAADSRAQLLRLALRSFRCIDYVDQCAFSTYAPKVHG